MLVHPSPFIDGRLVCALMRHAGAVDSPCRRNLSLGQLSRNVGPSYDQGESLLTRQCASYSLHGLPGLLVGAWAGVVGPGELGTPLRNNEPFRGPLRF